MSEFDNEDPSGYVVFLIGVALAFDPGKDAGLDYDTVLDGKDLEATGPGSERCQALLDLDKQMAERAK
jgi:hypothetical protein